MTTDEAVGNVLRAAGGQMGHHLPRCNFLASPSARCDCGAGPVRSESEVRAIMSMRERAALVCEEMGAKRCAQAIRELPLEAIP